MIKTIRYSILIGFLLFSMFFIQAQEKKEGLVLIHQELGSKILLRWSPKSYADWNQGNRNGYVVQSYLLDSIKGRVFQFSDTVRLTPFKEWRMITDTSDRAAIVAQAIFGENFKMEAQQNNVLEFINKAQEQDNRFSFALLMASQNFELAKQMGLAAEYELNNKNKYVIKVFVNSLNPDYISDTAYQLVRFDKTIGLPQILDLTAKFTNKQVKLSWPTNYIQKFYNGYEIQRSEDATHFTNLTRKMYANLKSSVTDGFFYYMDTVGLKNRHYYYRVRGINSFGQKGPYSDTAKVSVFPPLNVKPQIDTIIQGEDGLTVKWKFPENEQNKILGFWVYQSTTINENYQRLNQEPFPVDKRQFTTSIKKPSNYFMVGAENLGGEVLFSLPYMSQIVDSVPPLSPKGIKGSIDTTGIMKIKWMSNTEKDIGGYRVFFTTNPSKDFTEISKEIISDNFFTYKVPLNWLNKKVYVKILAEDIYYNYSPFSKVVALAMPDTIAPTPPVIVDYKHNESGNFIHWKNSHDNDVKTTILFRAKGKESKQILTFSESKESEFTDKNIEGADYYDYYLITTDSAGNSSKSNIVRLRGIPAIKKVKLKGYHEANGNKITLEWQVPYDNIQNIYVYKAKTGEPLRLFKTLSGENSNFIDALVDLNQTYQYKIRVRSVSNTFIFSKTITVNP